MIYFIYSENLSIYNLYNILNISSKTTKTVQIKKLQCHIIQIKPTTPLSVDSILVEGGKHACEVPSQYQRQHVQHNEKGKWIKQDNCVFQKR